MTTTSHSHPDRHWTTGEEVKFVKSLSDRGLEGYKRAINMRTRWGEIRKCLVYKELGA